jgi:nucleoside-diphosphate-sugar epimerase
MENFSEEQGNTLENTFNVTSETILLAGATGDLGQRIATHLLHAGATVKALVRAGSSQAAITALEKMGALIIEVDFDNKAQLVAACSVCSCVVSAMSGLRDVIIDIQTALLQSAMEAGVPRFIPSDYCIDYTKLPYGSNRNLDLRREFSERLNSSPIRSTSVLNGMFTDLLTGQAPVILFGLKRIVYWGDDAQLLDFTTIDNTAAYTAHAALDDTTPRYLRIAGEVIDANGLKKTASEVTGKVFRLLRAGRLDRLKTIIKITRSLFPQKREVFPPWQGMQYMHNMFTGLPKLNPLENDRYPGIRWTSVKEVIAMRTD